MSNEQAITLITGGHSYETLPAPLQEILDCIIDAQSKTGTIGYSKGGAPIKGSIDNKSIPVADFRLVFDEEKIDRLAQTKGISGFDLIGEMHHYLQCELTKRGLENIISRRSNEHTTPEQALQHAASETEILGFGRFSEFARVGEHGVEVKKLEELLPISRDAPLHDRQDQIEENLGAQGWHRVKIVESGSRGRDHASNYKHYSLGLTVDGRYFGMNDTQIENHAVDNAAIEDENACKRADGKDWQKALGDRTGRIK